jgi:hypothetical protein
MRPGRGAAAVPDVYHRHHSPAPDRGGILFVLFVDEQNYSSAGRNSLGIALLKSDLHHSEFMTSTAMDKRIMILMSISNDADHFVRSAVGGNYVCR